MQMLVEKHSREELVGKLSRCFMKKIWKCLLLHKENVLV